MFQTQKRVVQANKGHRKANSLEPIVIGSVAHGVRRCENRDSGEHDHISEVRLRNAWSFRTGVETTGPNCTKCKTQKKSWQHFLALSRWEEPRASTYLTPSILQYLFCLQRFSTKQIEYLLDSLRQMHMHSTSEKPSTLSVSFPLLHHTYIRLSAHRWIQKGVLRQDTLA